ncbi:peptide ABC transporter substrate-binding protein [Phytohabitans suffuscus]|uniref:Peptide ABC transporter substrate-binding protein n=1 Tax=Phytohabitans suffuscus TaxID=624315 RepID=A0A6F8YL84_9ACTN|nr:ABC transporter substrate-binding protein [Phytohabitans suffuscus]BCB86872.1 peptide ABC transporter substrate-binding protein [Phytohabitans suffuscus]
MQVRATAVCTVLALAGGLALTACDPFGGDSASGTGPRSVSVQIAQPRHLLPTNTNDADSAQVLAAIFAPLVRYDGEHRPRELAAESIKSTDHKVWTITLKDGYTFHNGEKVTADSYIDAWNYGAYAPNRQSNGYFFAKISGYADTQPADPDGPGPEPVAEPKAKTLSGLKKVDDRTFRVTLSTPFTEFKAMLGDTAFYPLPSTAWKEPGVLADGFEDAIVGQGPFRLKGGWRDKSTIEVERFDAYPGDKPSVDGAAFRIYDNLAKAYEDVRDGDLDVIRTIPAERVEQAREDLDGRVGSAPDSTIQFLAFPTFMQDFFKGSVRRAISMAIDRDAIVRSVFHGAQQPARSFVAPVVTGYRENSCGAACQFDPAEAKRLYTEAEGPATLQISYNDDGGHQAWVEATCAQLRANLGIQCVAVAEPHFGDVLAKVEERKAVGMFRMGWPMDYPSMESYLSPLYSTAGSSNYAGYRNARFDNLVNEAMQARDEGETIKKYQDAEDILARDMPVIPLRFGQLNYGYSARVKSLTLDTYTHLDLTKLTISPAA